MNIQNSKEIATEMFENQSFEEYDINNFIDILSECDNLYHNEDESYLTDSQYDFLFKYAETISPAHVYFTGVGSDVRGGKIKLPFEMGSLDQVEIGDIRTWIKKYNLSDEQVVITDKLDGTSAMVVYDNDAKLQIAYSRGNGVEGADITRHISQLRTVPERAEFNIVVRGEAIIEKATFPFLSKEFSRKSGKPYKNARNAVAGFMNSKTNEEGIYNYIRFVAYQIVGSELSKTAQLERLEELGFEVPYYSVNIGEMVTDDMLAKYLNLRRQDSIFEIDGLVLDVNDSTKRNEMNPTRDTLNPAYAIKYKVADADNLALATVVRVHWQISKHGYLKPRIEIEPVDLQGVTITYTTGFNAAYIENNHIGEGTVLEITRSGDVIPFILRIIKSTIQEMPAAFDWDWDWTYNEAGEKVDARLNNPDDYEEVVVKRMVNFFEKIEAPMLKEGSVQKLYNAGYKTIESIIQSDQNDLVDVLGKNGIKIFEGLTNKLTNVLLYKIMGAYSTERGIGVRRLKKLQSALGTDGLLCCNNAIEVAEVEGFDTKTAEQTIKVIDKFVNFYSIVDDIVTLAEDEKVGTSLANMQVCFTGIRDKELAAKIESLGGKVTSSVSSKTTMVVAKDPDSNSGKPKKARELGIPIMGIVEFKQLINGD